VGAGVLVVVETLTFRRKAHSLFEVRSIGRLPLDCVS
jgi:hypothetical protein